MRGGEGGDSERCVCWKSITGFLAELLVLRTSLSSPYRLCVRSPPGRENGDGGPRLKAGNWVKGMVAPLGSGINQPAGVN